MPSPKSGVKLVGKLTLEICFPFKMVFTTVSAPWGPIIACEACDCGNPAAPLVVSPEPRRWEMIGKVNFDGQVVK